MQQLAAPFLTSLAGGARFLPLIVLTPIFGGRAVPAPVRIGLACALGLLVTGLPKHPGTAPAPSASFFAAELCTGLLIALPVVFAIKGVAVVGQCLDQICGTNAIELLFPGGEDRGAPMAQFAEMTVVLACLSAGVHLELVRLCAGSIAAIGPGHLPSIGQRTLAVMISSFAGAFTGGVVLGIPFLVLAIGVETAFNFAGRLAPGFHLAAEAGAVKNAASLCLLIVLWGFLCSSFTGWGWRMAGTVRLAVAAMAG